MYLSDSKYKDFYEACEASYLEYKQKAIETFNSTDERSKKSIINHLRIYGHLIGDLHNHIVELAKIHLVDQDDYNTQILIDTQNHYLDKFKNLFK